MLNQFFEGFLSKLPTCTGTSGETYDFSCFSRICPQFVSPFGRTLPPWLALHLWNSRNEMPKPAVSHEDLQGIPESDTLTGMYKNTIMAKANTYQQVLDFIYQLSTVWYKYPHVYHGFFHSHCYHPPRFSIEFCFSSKEHPGSGHLETKHQDLLFHLPGQVLMGGAGGFGVWSGVLCYESLSKVVKNLTQPDVKNNDDNGAVKCKQAYLDLLKRQRLKLDQIGRTGGQLECINKIK